MVPALLHFASLVFPFHSSCQALWILRETRPSPCRSETEGERRRHLSIRQQSVGWLSHLVSRLALLFLGARKVLQTSGAGYPGQPVRPFQRRQAFVVPPQLEMEKAFIR